MVVEEADCRVGTTAEPKWSLVAVTPSDESGAIMSHDRVRSYRSHISSWLSFRASTRRAAKVSRSAAASWQTSVSVDGLETSHRRTTRSNLKSQVV